MTGDLCNFFQRRALLAPRNVCRHNSRRTPVLAHWQPRMLWIQYGIVLHSSYTTD